VNTIAITAIQGAAAAETLPTAPAAEAEERA
jgi:hypothetical protein